MANHALQYQPIPLDRRGAILGPIHDGLRQREFAESSIRSDYIFTAVQDDSRVHQAAFTDARRWDPITAGVNFFYSPNDAIPHRQILEALAISGAPFNLIGGDDSASLYILSQNGGTRIKAIELDIAYDQVPQLFSRYSADITPHRIRRVKRGVDSFVQFPDCNALQLWLFAVELTGKILVEQFAAAVGSLRSAAEPGHQDATRVAVQLLAAIILAHKGTLGAPCSQQDASLEMVLAEASGRFPRYFETALVEQYQRDAENAYSILQQVRYSSFTPDVLEDLYVAAYPQKELRKWEGRYNTPLYLTQQILDNIPLEMIPPADRVVADMTCGVGNFLQSAYERLNDMVDMPDSGRPLRDHIFGNDLDPFTAQLAGLSLLLTSQTDHWSIDHEDALQWKWLSQHAPSVIVGNPPFRGGRRSGRGATRVDAETGQRRRYEKAVAFLERAIARLAPGGYLAMVMPQSFGVSEAAPSARRQLLEKCDVLEIWELPNQVFPDATLQPKVLFAQRKPVGTRQIWPMPVRIRTVQRKMLDDFKFGGAFTASSVFATQEMWGSESRRGPKNTHLMKYQTILSFSEWSAIQERTMNLDNVADITQGAIVGSKSRWRWVDYEEPKLVPWLSGVKKVIPRPYLIRYGNDTKLYPNEIERPRKNRRSPHLDKEHLLAGEKVLLVSDPNPSWGQRAKVAVERRGYYPSDSFWVLAPKPDDSTFITLEVLAAVVEWHVSNAWIVEHLKAPKISSYALKTIPFPRNLSAADCQGLVAAVHQLEAAAQHDQDAPKARLVIDQILKAAYQLDDVIFERLRMVAKWPEFDPVVLKKQKPSPHTLVFVTGGVEEVDAQNGRISLWLNSFSGVQETVITDEMPGWMLRPGATFCAEMSEENYRCKDLDGVVWAHIAPQQYTYFSEEDLLTHLATVFST